MKGLTVNEKNLLNVSFKNFETGDRVRYINGSRLNLYSDKIGIVEAVRTNWNDDVISCGVKFDSEDELVWASVGTWRKLPQLIEQDFDIERIFTDAAGGPLEVAKAELARLEARVAELKTAIKVIESI
jgi:hypothetical protein